MLRNSEVMDMLTDSEMWIAAGSMLDVHGERLADYMTLRIHAAQHMHVANGDKAQYEEWLKVLERAQEIDDAKGGYGLH